MVKTSWLTLYSISFHSIYLSRVPARAPVIEQLTYRQTKNNIYFHKSLLVRQFISKIKINGDQVGCVTVPSLFSFREPPTQVPVLTRFRCTESESSVISQDVLLYYYYSQFLTWKETLGTIKNLCVSAYTSNHVHEHTSCQQTINMVSGKEGAQYRRYKPPTIPSGNPTKEQ